MSCLIHKNLSYEVRGVLFDVHNRLGPRLPEKFYREAKDLPYPDLTNRLLELCHRVHFTLGPGFLHQVYRRAARIELDYQELSYTYLKKLPITYQGQQIGMQDVRLLAVEDNVLLATVAVKKVDEVMKAQMQSRLKHLGFQLGLLANFHGTTLEVVTVRV